MWRTILNRLGRASSEFFAATAATQAPAAPQAASCLEPLESRLLMSVAAGYDPILHWNNVAMDVALVDSRAPFADQPGPTSTSRAMAIVHAAMFDAYNGITSEYRHYLSRQQARGASTHAAVAQAAHDTLVSLYPKQMAEIDALYNAIVDDNPHTSAESKGLRHGAHVAKMILRSRKNDGAQRTMNYTPGNQPGDHQVDPLNPGQPFLSPLWGKVKPFTMLSNTQFAPAPFPSLNSAEYAAAYEEVRAVGALDAETSDRNGDNEPDRTDDQTEIGIYWGYDHRLGSPVRIYNAAARVVAEQEGNTVSENARLFTLLHLAMADAGCNAWAAKYLSDRDIWRPIVGIRMADTDGNAATVAEPNWVPLGAPGNFGDPAGFAGNPGPDADPDPVGGPDFTPPFPAYTSGHATFGGAAFGILENFYGTDDITFSLYSEDSDTTRTFNSFKQAADENGISRIYLGVHWRQDWIAGQAAGYSIANYAESRLLLPKR